MSNILEGIKGIAYWSPVIASAIYHDYGKPIVKYAYEKTSAVAQTALSSVSSHFCCLSSRKKEDQATIEEDSVLVKKPLGTPLREVVISSSTPASASTSASNSVSGTGSTDIPAQFSLIEKLIQLLDWLISLFTSKQQQNETIIVTDATNSSSCGSTSSSGSGSPVVTLPSNLSRAAPIPEIQSAIPSLKNTEKPHYEKATSWGKKIDSHFEEISANQLAEINEKISPQKITYGYKEINITDNKIINEYYFNKDDQLILRKNFEEKKDGTYFKDTYLYDPKNNTLTKLDASYKPTGTPLIFTKPMIQEPIFSLKSFLNSSKKDLIIQMFDPEKFSIITYCNFKIAKTPKPNTTKVTLTADIPWIGGTLFTATLEYDNQTHTLEKKIQTTGSFSSLDPYPTIKSLL